MMNKKFLVAAIALVSTTASAIETNFKMELTTNNEKLETTMTLTNGQTTKFKDIEEVAYLSSKKLNDKNKPVPSSYRSGKTVEIKRLYKEHDFYSVSVEFLDIPKLSHVTKGGVELSNIDYQYVTKSQMKVQLSKGDKKCIVLSESTGNVETNIQRLCLTAL